MNTGGTTDQGGFTVTLVRADHSAALVEMGANTPVGSANGIIVKAPGEPTIYHMGDTDIFGDMALIAEIHKPDVVIVPIGDRFTMGPQVAALAVRRYFGGVRRRFPVITGRFRSSSPMPTRSWPPSMAAAFRSWCPTRRSACASEIAACGGGVL